MVFLAGCVQLAHESRGVEQLAGRWQSIKVEGKAAAFFRPVVGTTSLCFASGNAYSAEVVSLDGKSKEAVSGTYRIDGKTMRLTPPDGPVSNPAEFWFENKVLVMQDPNYDFRVYYERKSDD